MKHTVAILHTTPATIASLTEKLHALAPYLTVRNYLDESLLPQINQEGSISEACAERFFLMCQSAEKAQPDAMLCACSSVGGLVEQYAPGCSVPFLRIDEPMARQAAARGGRIIVVATLDSTLAPTLDLIARKGATQVDKAVIREAGALLSAGKLEAYKALLQERLAAYAQSHDTVVLAQASMACGLEGLEAVLREKFLTSPDSGTAALVAYIQKENENDNGGEQA